MDIDAVHAYDRALKEVDDEIIQSRLNEFQKQHRDHIRVIFEQIRAAGG